MQFIVGRELLAVLSRLAPWLILLSKGHHSQSESFIVIFIFLVIVHINPTVYLSKGEFIAFEGDVI